MTGIGIYLIRQLPSPQKLVSSEDYAVSTQIFDRNNILLYEIYADENRIPIKIEDLPEHITQATIAIEDRRFLSSPGHRYPRCHPGITQ